MLAKQEAEKRQEDAMMSGKPVQQADDTQLERVCLYCSSRVLTGSCVMLSQAALCTKALWHAGQSGSAVTNILF